MSTDRPAAWQRTTVDDDLQYRDGLLNSRLSRAATTADILAGAFVAGRDDPGIVEALAAVRNQVEEEMGAHASWSSQHHAAYLRSATEFRVNNGRTLADILGQVVERAEAHDRDGVGQLIEQLHGTAETLSKTSTYSRR